MSRSTSCSSTLAAASLLVGCVVSESPPPTSRLEALRETATTVVPPATPDCDLLLTCPELNLDVSRCVDDPSLFAVTMLGALVVDVAVEDDQVALAGLEAGTWYGVFPDPTGGCEHAVVGFAVGEES